MAARQAGALVRAIDDLCRSERDLTELRSAIIDLMRGTLGLDAYVWVLTDPHTCVGSAPLAEVPRAALPRLPELIRAKYATAVNRWTAIGPVPARSLQAATAGNLADSLVWREALHRYDVVDVASAVFRDRYGCWAFLDLWRMRPGELFTRKDIDLLAAVVEMVTPTLRTRQIPQFERSGTPELPHGPVVLMLTSDLEVTAQTPHAAGYLRRLVPPSEGGAPIPAAAYNVAAQLMAVERGVDDHPARTRIHLRDGVWLTARAARLGQQREGHSVDVGRPIAVTLEISTPAERADLLAAVCGFTRREAQLLALLAAGTDTSEAAARMSLSEHTIQDHLKAMFAKAGVHSRRALLARATGG